MGSSASGSSSFRLDIQGLRAVAALLVATYHIWLGRVSGGVDVFFVVSAYLITTMLLRQHEKSGGIDLAEFWGGLARRLLPMAMLVMAAVVVASVFWLPRPLWDETIQQVIASVFYLENWQLAFDAVDYLAQGQAASPVQHYWALSIQGQFYLIWPFVMMTAFAIATRVKSKDRDVLLGVFAAIFLCSLAFSVVATRNHQTFTYFNTVARLWEFGIGAMFATVRRFELPRAAKVAMGWLGLAGILACGMLFQVSRVFPGYAALWPVCCALMIMLAGPSGSRIGADRFLSLKPLVYLGGISYGIYLWHWPMLIFYRWLAGHIKMGLLEGVAVLVGAIAMADISTRLLDKLTEKKGAGARKAGIGRFVTVGVSPVLLLAIAWGGYFLHQKKHDERPIALEDPDYPGARAREAGFRYQGHQEVALYPGMLAVQDDLPQIFKDGCYKPDPEWQRAHCTYGDRKSSHVLALVGGSHSAHWLPALDLLGKTHHFRVVVYSKSNCLFSELDASIEAEKLDRWCRQWNEGTLEILRKDRPEVIFTTATRGSGAGEFVPNGFLERWAKLDALGIKVIAVRDTPWMEFWVPECLEVHGHDSHECSQSAEHVLARLSPLERLAKHPANVRFIDMTDYFCDGRECPGVIGNVIVYRDDSHITAAYARTLAPMLARRLQPVMPQGWIRTPQDIDYKSAGKLPARISTERS